MRRCGAVQVVHVILDEDCDVGELVIVVAQMVEIGM
jgi:hypothetical protein